jgi:hypothetical protein
MCAHLASAPMSDTKIRLLSRQRVEQTADSREQTADSRQRRADSEGQRADSRQQPADSSQQPADRPRLRPDAEYEIQASV